MSWPLRIVATLLTAALCLLATVGQAQMSPQAQFIKGQELFEAKKYDEALPLFRNAFDKTKSPNASLYVARCLEKLGKLDEAYKEMQLTVGIATEKAEKDEKYATTRDAAAGELAQLKPRVGLLVIAFTEAYEGATVTVNDRELVDSELGQPFPVMPGEVVIVGSASGRETVTKNEDVSGGETKTIALALPEAGGNGDEPPPPNGDGFELTTLRIVGFAVGGLGVVGMVVFAITGSLAASKFSDIEEECRGQRCTDPKFESVIDKGKTQATVANVSVGIGAACLIAGTLLVILGGPDDDGAESEEEGDVSIAPHPGGAAISVAF